MEASRTPLSLALLAICAMLWLAACGDTDDDLSADRSTSSADAGVVSARDKSEPAPPRDAGGSSGVTLTGDATEAREAGETVSDVYRRFDAAIGAGIASDDIAVDDLLADAAGDPNLRAVCELMSRSAQRQTIEYARRSARLADVDWTCAKATALLLRSGEQEASRTEKARIVGINAEGNHATATVRFGPKSPLVPVALVKEDGEWRLGGPAFVGSP